jgi:hypothetical protein
MRAEVLRARDLVKQAFGDRANALACNAQFRNVKRRMNESSQPQTIAFGLLGAVAGGCLGYFAFFWIAQQGFYALVVPPALLGLAAGVCARQRSPALAAICGVAGLALGIFIEWRASPFLADNSLSYFLAHLHALRPITLIMLALGAFLSYRLALGHDRKSSVS